jgi:spore maturation protein CgeB
MHKELGLLAAAYDLIIICKGNSIPTKTVQMLSQKSRVYLWFMDWWPQVQKSINVMEYSKYCHYRSATGYEVAVKWEKEIKLPVYHIMDGADPELFHPMKISKKYDVLFIGQKDPERLSVKEYLEKNTPYKISFNGPGFNEHADNEKFKRLCNSSHIVLNMSRGIVEGYTSLRLWSVMACGSMVLTKKIPNMNMRMGLVLKHHLDEFGSMEELKNKVDYYMKHVDKRIEMSRNARDYILNHRTWSHVAKEIILTTVNNPGELSK